MLRTLTRLALGLAVVLAGLGWAMPTFAADYRFTLDKNISRVTINRDGSVDVEYWLTYTCDAGAHPIDIVDVGMPNSSYRLDTVRADLDGDEKVTVQKSELVNPGVEVHLLDRTIQPGKTGTLHLMVNVPQMVYLDSQDANYASVEFSPHWYDAQNVHGTTDMAVSFVFPAGVTNTETKWHYREFDEVDKQDERIVFTWREPKASPSKQYKFGVGFPKSYVDTIAAPSAGGTSTVPDFLTEAMGCLCNGGCWGFGIFGAIIIFGVMGSVVSAFRVRGQRMKYMPPAIGVEGVGVKRGLTAVESAILLETPLDKALTMILFGLMKKSAVRVTAEKPLTLEPTDKPPADLYSYEKNFLAAIDQKGRVDDKALREMMVLLVRAVNDKLKGFSRKETVAYYRDIVSRAWGQVQAANTPELKSRALTENIDWTMLDEDFNKKIGPTLGPQPILLPYWWWWGLPGRVGPTAPAPVPTGAPSVGLPQVQLPTLPGADFANTIVTGIEGFANNVVTNIEQFTTGVTKVTNPAALATSSTGRSYKSGGCACACACACAGCACACAGGGR
jgi:hypothetical protein